MQLNLFEAVADYAARHTLSNILPPSCMKSDLDCGQWAGLHAGACTAIMSCQHTNALRCCNGCAVSEKRAATSTERHWLTATGIYKRPPARAALLSVKAACKLLQHFRTPADQIKAVQSLSSAAAMTQAEIRSLLPIAVKHPSSAPTPEKQQHPPPLQEPPCRLNSASKQPAAASKRPSLPAQAAAQSASPAAHGQMGAEASRDATEGMQPIHRPDPSTLACHEQLVVNASPSQETHSHGLLSQGALDRPRQDMPGPCTAHGKAFSLSICSVL